MTPQQKTEFKAAFRKAAEVADQTYTGDKTRRSAPLKMAAAIDEETPYGRLLLDVAQREMERSGETIENFVSRCFASVPKPTNF